jgi:hypothetical protein
MKSPVEGDAKRANSPEEFTGVGRKAPSAIPSGLMVFSQVDHKKILWPTFLTDFHTLELTPSFWYSLIKEGVESWKQRREDPF